MKFKTGLTLLVTLAFATNLRSAERVDFFILWGISMACEGEVQIQDGKLIEARPYLIAKTERNRVELAGKNRVTWVATGSNKIQGVELTAEVAENTLLRLRVAGEQREIPWSKFPRDVEEIVRLKGGKLLILGRGDPRKGPYQPPALPLPALFQTPVPRSPIALPDDWWRKQSPVVVRLSERASAFHVRRVAGELGRLCLELFSATRPLSGTAEVEFAGARLGSVKIQDAVWLSLAPRIGRLKLVVEAGDQRTEFSVPTTLVETRGSRLFVNGEPFLIKGALGQELNEADADYIKTLGLNTLRGRKAVASAEQFGFMAHASIQWGAGVVDRQLTPTEAEFHRKVDLYVENLKSNALTAAASPHTLIIQIGNEQYPGSDPWEPRLGKIRPFERLDYMLASGYNLVKPMAPMLPIGYANHAFGYVAPPFLDVYMHNSYIAKDKFDRSVRQFMELQGCSGPEAVKPSATGARRTAGRPFVNSEFGANVYLPQAYLGGPNNPFLEKLQAWNYVQRWREYLEGGTVGGTCYCLYDLEKPTDHGSSCFGIMTFDRQPKLACWEIGHLWRDFEVAPVAKGTSPQLQIQFRRDYHARDCRLTLTSGSEKKVLPLDDFQPNEQRVITMPLSGESFHWRMDFTTHGGLTLAATGAYPRPIEESDFLAGLKSRTTRDFLTTLFDAEVVTVSGRPAPPTTAEMARPDGVIPVALRKRNGTVYLTLITRKEPKARPYEEGLTVDVAFTGRVEAVNDMTGQPNGEPVEVEPIPGGLKLKNVRAANLPGAYGKRFPKPFALPVYRIVPGVEK